MLPKLLSVMSVVLFILGLTHAGLGDFAQASYLTVVGLFALWARERSL